ncbi:MAG TPA: SDR family oxidoreductase [Cyclobacteriaceae bacterium]|nr:SDR family oxidoreductase [Cyclobacteriaceae bacterium]HMV08610.1 SDR family oxidoreductase [Cyclobacteriaceae bacterium]HMV90587.1 SDR family oxidoreductase [Cyclobacteriaceae bacterium]HMX00181.1 SDR family oxidoreductase [Cyclobacteriaceae bacterium]HMX49820.1 SDR family oxidoreductase [Cyclobacteriaceae bacterium]
MTTSKIALVTGGSRGLGENTAIALAKKGHDIIITYNSQQSKADAVVKQVEAAGRKAAALQFDASKPGAVSQLITDLKETLRKTWNRDTFDFLINNAGIGATIPFEKSTEQDFDNFMNIHFKSVYFLSQQALQLMNDGGRIINLSSGTTRFVNPGYSIYASMKGAVEVLTRYIAKEIGSRKITVNVVAPGPVETDFNNAAVRNAPPERKNMLAANTALGRIGQPDDIGGVIAFLCSEEAGWINGQRIEASGGINL